MQAQQTCACMCLASVCQTRRCLLSVCKNHRSACSLRVYTADMKEKKFISFTKTKNSACIATNHVELSFKIVTSHITVHLTSQIVWTKISDNMQLQHHTNFEARFYISFFGWREKQLLGHKIFRRKTFSCLLEANNLKWTFTGKILGAYKALQAHEQHQDFLLHS